MSFWDDLLGKTAAKGSTDAAAAQTKALDKSAKTTKQGTIASIGYQKPYEQSGQASNKLLSDALGVNGPDAQKAYFANFQNDPGYQATVDAGLNAVDQGQTFAGNFRSGNTLRSLLQTGQRMMYDQFTGRLNQLAGLGQQGFNAATNMSNLRMQGTSQLAGIQADKGTAQASGIVGAANAKTAGATHLFNAGAGLLGAGIKSYFAPKSSIGTA